MHWLIATQMPQLFDTGFVSAFVSPSLPWTSISIYLTFPTYPENQGNVKCEPGTAYPLRAPKITRRFLIVYALVIFSFLCLFTLYLSLVYIGHVFVSLY